MPSLALDHDVQNVTRYRDHLAAPDMDWHEELSLVERSRNGDQAARNQLIENHLRLPIYHAMRYYKPFYHPRLTIEDLIAEGNLALFRAIDKFDPSKGMRFGSYASLWIRDFMQRHMLKNSRSVQVPIDIQKRKQPMPVEVSIDEQPDLLRMHRESDDSLIKVQAREVSVLVRKMVAELSQDELTLISLRFGLNGSEPLSLIDVGEQVGMKRESCRMEIKRIIQKLKIKAGIYGIDLEAI
ncbi:MAG: sigma-70 family RNA polymerase sigma factor [Gammaproteobacteria bacterium]